MTHFSNINKESKLFVDSKNLNNFFLLQVDSEEERLPNEKEINKMAKNLPQGTDKTPEILDSALKGVSDR